MLTPRETAAELRDFPVVIELPVQWGDQDMFGHVNNTVYFRWFESARIAYLERLGLAHRVSSNNLGPILAAIGCNYRKQIKYPDTVQIGARVARLGRTSITMEHHLWSQANAAIGADGQSTVVVFDYVANKPRAIPDEMRKVIEELEGRPV